MLATCPGPLRSVATITKLDSTVSPLVCSVVVIVVEAREWWVLYFAGLRWRGLALAPLESLGAGGVAGFTARVGGYIGRGRWGSRGDGDDRHEL